MIQEIEQQIEEVIAILEKHPEGLSRGQITEKISFSINGKTLQRRLLALAEEGRIAREGIKKATRYYPSIISIETHKGHLKNNSANIFSPKSEEKLKFLALLQTDCKSDLYY